MGALGQLVGVYATGDLKVKAVVQVMARDSENSASEKVVEAGLGFRIQVFFRVPLK